MYIKLGICILYPFLILLIVNFNDAIIQSIPANGLRVTCSFLDDKSSIIKTVPPGCTAIATDNVNDDAIGYTKSMKKDLPYVLLDELYIRPFFSGARNIKGSDYVKSMVDTGFQVIIFNEMCGNYGCKAVPDVQGYSKKINEFLQDIKSKYQGIKLGIQFDNDFKNLKDNYNFKAFDSMVDYYLFYTINYGTCNNDVQQPTATKEKVIGTINDIMQLGVSSNKIIIAMNPTIVSIVDTLDFQGYSYVCTTRFSHKRKFCYCSIDDIFGIAQLYAEKKLGGILMMNTHNDDYNGNCGCSTIKDSSTLFPFLRIVNEGSINGNIDNVRCQNKEFPTINQ